MSYENTRPMVAFPLTQPPKIMRIYNLPTFALLCALLFVFATTAHAQEASDTSLERQARFIMLNQSVCPGEGMQKAMELFEQKAAPILNEMQQEGAIGGWGVLGHSWGDEYNFNWFMIAENHEAWHQAWGTMVSRMNERHPGWIEESINNCTLHKDNLYTLYTWN